MSAVCALIVFNLSRIYLSRKSARESIIVLDDEPGGGRGRSGIFSRELAASAGDGASMPIAMTGSALPEACIQLF